MSADTDDRSLFIPVILGTSRMGRASENVARFVVRQLAAMPEIETELVDVRELAPRIDGAARRSRSRPFRSSACGRTRSS